MAYIGIRIHPVCVTIADPIDMITILSAWTDLFNARGAGCCKDKGEKEEKS